MHKFSRDEQIVVQDPTVSSTRGRRDSERCPPFEDADVEFQVALILCHTILCMNRQWCFMGVRGLLCHNLHHLLSCFQR